MPADTGPNNVDIYEAYWALTEGEVTLRDVVSFLFRTGITSVQPMLANSAVRPRWINIHSHHDIISGGLQYFDSALTPRHARVQNIIDPDARVPFAAHVEYWENPLLWKTLLAVL
ncbi:MAG: hypothetical protein QOI24_237 [Acidobacteriota bacterium]|nr:hypothetical protein [Acidobacteriota bacterium]